MADNFLIKAIRSLIPQPVPRNTKESRGTMSGYTLGMPPLWGQPYPEQVPQINAGDQAVLISRERMREIVLRTPTAAACMNAILDFAGGVEIGLRNIDASKPLPSVQKNKVNRIMSRPNPNQTKRQFLLTLMRDIIVFGYGAVEIVPTGKPDNPVDLWVVDSARLKIDFDEHGLIRGYDMVDIRGVPIIRPGTEAGNEGTSGTSVDYSFPQGPGIGFMGMPSYRSQMAIPTLGQNFGANLHAWEPNEIIFFSLNPISESVYPHSRIVQLFSAALLEDLMIQFISERFTDSNIPFGVFDLGDVSEQELRIAIDNWNTQGKTGNRILMTGSRGSGSKWFPFGYHLKDLEATALLAEFRMKIMGILGVTMQELGESQDVSKSNGYNLSFTFKKRAIEPILDEITQTFTMRLLWDVLKYEDAEFYYEEIDSRDELIASQIDTNYQKLGLSTPNEIRNRRGLTSVPGGDEAIIFTGNSWIPVDMIRDMARQIIKIEAETSSIGASGAEGFRVRENVPAQGGNTGAPGQQNPSRPQPVGASNGHDRGATSEMARRLGGSG